MPWRPLLSGARRDAAITAVEAIARELSAESRPALGPSLSRGAAGHALVFTYLAEALPGRSYESFADGQLAVAIDALASDVLGPALYSGYTGIAMVYDLVARTLYSAPPEDDALLDIDEALLGALSPVADDVSHELIGGLAGHVAYAVGRGTAKARPILEAVLDALDARAERSAAGACWSTAPAIMAPSLQASAPPRSYLLGLSHGIPGTIGALAAIALADPDNARARALLGDGLRWLFAQVSPTGPSGLAYAASDAPYRVSRLAWCYGDPGAAVASLWAARIHGDPSLIAAALALGRRAAIRTQDGSEVVDAGLCHGAAGLAHLFNRLWQDTGEAIFEQAALRWIDETLAYPLTSHHGLLEGMAGIAAALAAATCDVEPRWDRVLLASPPTSNA